MLTTPRRSRRAGSSRGRARPPGLMRSRRKSWTWIWASFSSSRRTPLSRRTRVSIPRATQFKVRAGASVLRLRRRIRRCSASPRRSSACRSRSCRCRGCRFRRRQVGHLRAVFSAASSSTWRCRRAGTCQAAGTSGPRFSGGIGAGEAPAKPVGDYTIVGTSVPRIDIPAIVERGVYLYPERPGAGDAARARRAAAWADGVWLRRADRVGRRELDRAHPRRARGTHQQLPRRCRAEGVRRDPGGERS